MNSTINDDGPSALVGPGLVESSAMERPIDKDPGSFFHSSLTLQNAEQSLLSQQHLFSAKTTLNLDDDSLQKLIAILD